MPRLVIHDGYTLKAKTKETAENNVGKVVAENLPIVEFSYRPALPEALAEWRYSLERAPSGKATVAITAQFVCDHLVSWDVVDGKNVLVPIKPETVKLIPEPILSQIVDAIITWAPKAEEAAGNSSGGSGSPS